MIDERSDPGKCAVWERRGDSSILQGPPRSASLADKLEFRGWSVTPGGCWCWSGRGFSGVGYGKIRFNGRELYVHRAAYEAWVGPIPEGQVVRHKCDNPPCINPDHLEVGTHSDNAKDREQRGRGTRSGHAKLTEQDVLDIRTEYGYGVLTQQMLADVYGVKHSTISDITRGKTWTHVR